MNNPLIKSLTVRALPLVAVLLAATTYTTGSVEAQETQQQAEEMNMEFSVPASDDSAAKRVKIMIRGDAEGGNLETIIEEIASEEDSTDSEESSAFISIESSGDGIASIKEVIKTLAVTEWENLGEEDKQELLSSLDNLDDEMTIQVHRDADITEDSDAEDIVAIIAVFGLPLFLLIAILYYKHHKRMVKVALIKDYLAAGKDVPIEVLTVINGEEPDAPSDSFQSAVRNIAVGIGLILFLGIAISWELAAVGLIPLFIGIGKLVVWRMNRDSSATLAD
ncbi:MAG: DUF6249 domain-containing protein [Porticoccaceae bacterium]